jgi:hypothetical protein
MAEAMKVMGRKPWRMTCWLFPVVAALLAGCTPDAFGPANDPILGGAPYRPTTGNPVAANNTPRRDGSIPPIPGPASSGGNAILAGGSGGPSMDPSRNLQLGSGSAPGTLTGNTGSTNTGTWNPPAGGLAPTGGVSIGGPQPTGNEKETVIPGDSRPSPVVPGAVSTGLTFESLQAQLMTRGVIYQQLQWSGEKSDWGFRCAVPSRQNPGDSRVVETRGPDPLSAIKAAIDRIDSSR